MINIALIGYRYYPTFQEGEDIIVTFIPRLLSSFEGLTLCHTDIVEDRNGESVDELVKIMIKTGTKVVHYVNYRDPYNESAVDQQYIEAVKSRKPGLPILLTSAHPDAKDFAAKLDIAYLNVPLDIDQYENTLRGLVKDN